MNGRRLAILLIALTLGVVVVSGAAVADPGQHEVNVTDGAGTVDSTYRYDASAGEINVSNDGGSTWTQYSLSNSDESAVAIQWAIDNSTSTYDTILIGPGTYNGTVFVTESDRVISAVSGPSSTNLTQSGTEDYGFNISASRVTISNLSINGFGYAGVNVFSGSNNTVDNSTFDSNPRGVYLDSASTDAVVRDNTFTDNTVRHVNLNVVSGAEILDNSFSGGDASSAIRLYVSDSVLVDGNSINDNDYTNTFKGIRVWGNADDNQITNNQIGNNSGVGIYFEVLGSSYPDNNLVRGNNVSNNDETGIRVIGDSASLEDNVVNNNGGWGITIDTNDSHVLRNNTVSRNANDGVRFNGSSDNLVEELTANDNADAGIYVDGNSGNSVNQTIRDGHFDGNEWGIMLDNNGGGPNVVHNNTVANSVTHGIFVDRFSDSELTNNTVTGTGGRAIVISSSYRNRIENNTIANASGGSSSKGIDLSSAASDNIVADNTVQDMEGIGINVDPGLSFTMSNNTVRDNVVENVSEVGIYVTGNDTTVTDNLVTDSPEGITFHDIVSATVDGNNVSRNTDSGLRISSTTAIQVGDLTALDNDVGINISHADDITINGSLLNGGTTGVLFDDVQDGAIEETVAEGNQYGIQLSNGSARTTVTMVDLVNNDIGFYAINASETTLRASDITDNDYSGIYVDLSSNSTLRNNTVLDNNGLGSYPNAGISIDNSSDVVVDDNVVRRNRLAGMRLQYANRSRIIDNRVTENCGGNFGISIADTADVYVARNNVSNNTGDGMQIFSYSPNATIVDTRFDDNGGWGIQGASNTTMENLTVTGNTNSGIIVSDNSVVRNSTVRDNGRDGFYVSGNDVTITDSETVNNTEEEVYVHSTNSGLTATNLVIGTLPHDIADAHDVSFNELSGSDPAAPSDLETVGPATNMTAGAGGYANISVHYTGTQADGVDESTIDLYRYNGSSSSWETVSGSSVDTGAMSVSANVTSFSTFRMFGEASSSGGGGGGGGGFFLPPPSDPAPSFSIASIDLATSEVAVGETVTVTVQVDNDGDANGEYTTTLTADGQTVDSQTLSINSNWYETATLTTSFDQAGTYQLSVDGEAAGSVEVTGEAAFTTTDVSVSPASVQSGETVTISATVANDGDAEGTIDVPLIVNGQQVDSQSVTVGPGESETVTFEHTFDEPGEGTVTVGDQSAGTVQVSDDSDDSGGSEDDASGGGDDGTGLGVILVALLGITIAGGAGVYYLYPEKVRELVEQIQERIDELRT